jgi:predicted HicB family RNase H-like nuclease
MTEERKAGRPASGVHQVYISVRIPYTVAVGLHAVAKAKKTSRNKLIGDVLRAVVNEADQ